MAALARTLPTCLLALSLLALSGASARADREERPTDDSRYVKAAAFLDDARYGEALAPLEALIADDPDNADAYNLLGYALRKLGRLDEALARYRRALELRPNFRGAHEYIGETYLLLGQPERAREHLAFLDDDCWLPCEEYSDLKAAIARYEAEHKR